MSRSLRQVFSTDAGLTVLLVSLLVVLFVIFPFVPLGDLGRLLVTAGLTLVLLSGSFSFSGRPRLRRLAVILAIFALASHWLCHVGEIHGLLIWAYTSTILFLALTAGGVLTRVVGGDRVTPHHIQGAVAVYLMFGLIWACAYAVVEMRQPGAFNLPHMAEAGGVMESQQNDLRHLVYFSFVTLTTLGYGDISPASFGARTLVTLEALVGQLYLVILIARLVSLEVAYSGRGSPPSS